ncbi:oligosaccharide flippase family protein, partial [Dyella sp.]|uniref:oligosaccharide flippase family protein n=1 Tax=Dyella sp. TaxID=1869338 RepID=UPI002D77BE4F
IVVTEYGFNLSATREVVQLRNDPARLSRLFSAVMAVKLTLMCAGFVVMLLAVEFIASFRQDFALFAAVYLGVLGNVLFPVWLFQGLERMRQISVLTITARLLVTAAVFIFVRQQGDFRIAAALQASGVLLAGIFSLFFVPRLVKLKLCRPSLREMREVMMDGWHVFVATIGGSLYNGSNVVALGLLASPIVVGYYAAAEKLIKALQSAISPISQAVYPHIAALLKRSRADALHFLSRLLKLQGGGTLAISLILLIFAHPVALLLFGTRYEPSGDLIRIMWIIPFIIGLNNIMGAQVLVQFSLGRLLSYSIMLPALLHVSLLYPVVELAGVTGVAVLAVITEALVLLIRIGGLARWHREIVRGLLGRVSDTYAIT